jgi:tetratricopeptide (TPR) repeat protein
MTRNFILVSVLATVTVLAAEPQRALGQDLPPAVKKIQPSVVTLIAYDSSGNFLQQGSGFFFNQQGHLIGCLHVLHGASKVEVKTKAGKTYELVSVGAMDREADLFSGATSATPADLANLQFSIGAPRVDASVFVVGVGSGAEQPFVQGAITAIREIPGFGRIVETTAPISASLSGGPIIDEKGNLIGVALLQAVATKNRYFALPIGRLAGLRQERVGPGKEWSSGREKEWSATAAGANYTGINYIWLEEYARALPYFEGVAKRHPKQAAEAFFNIGLCNFKMNHWQEAADAFKQVTQLRPKQPAAYQQLGLSLEKLNRWEDAVEAYKQFSLMKPNEPWALVNLGTAYGHLGRFDDELASCKQAIAVKSDFFPGYYCLGLVYERLNKWPEAVESLKQATQLAPASVEALDDLGVAYGETKHWQEAIDAYKRSLALKPDDTTAQYNIGVAYGNAGQYAEAVQSYLLEIKLNPDDTDAMDNLGIAYGKLGRWEDAVEALRKLTEKKPDDPQAQDSLGSAYYKVGKYREAILAHKTAVKLSPDAPKCHYNLAVAYLAVKERTAALEEYRTLKPLDADLAAKLYALIGK